MRGRCAAQLRSIGGRDPEFAALHKSSLTRQGSPGNPFVGIAPCGPTPGPAYGSIQIGAALYFPNLSCSFSRTCKPWTGQAAAAIGGLALPGEPARNKIPKELNGFSTSRRCRLSRTDGPEGRPVAL